MKHTGKHRETYRGEIGSWPEADRTWAVQAAAMMLLFGADETAIGPKLAEVRESVAASGQTPSELFGKPEAYGRTTGKRLRPPSDILERNLPFRSITGGVQVMLLTFGMLLIVLGIWVGIDDGWAGHSGQGQLMLLFPLLAFFVGLGLWA